MQYAFQIIGALLTGVVILAGLITLYRKVRQVQWIGDKQQKLSQPEQSSNTAADSSQ